MNGTLAETRALVEELVRSLKGKEGADRVLCPPFTALSVVFELIQGSSIELGGQDLYWERSGAFTGEISALLLKDAGCRYCIIGHSERRTLLGETDSVIHLKLLGALEQGLKPILCIGETDQARQAGKSWEVVKSQLEQALEKAEPDRVARSLTLAYEPVWAIGTGQNATPAQAQEIHAQIRSWLSNRFGKGTAESVRIQYGGSVKPENAGELMAQPDVDGALVGGASLNAKAFTAIVEAALQAKKEERCSTG